MDRNAEQNAPVDDARFVEFLQEKTASDLDVSSIGSHWSGLQAAVWEQGDDTFTSPPLDAHFISLCLSGFALADIRMASLSGSRVSVVDPGALCFMPAGDTADFCAEGRFEVAHVLLGANAVNAVLAEHSSGDPSLAQWQGFHGRKHQSMTMSIHRILAEMRTPTTSDPLIADRLGIELAQHLVGYACDIAPSRAPCSSKPYDITPLQFVTAIDYIETRLDQSFGLDEIAAYVGVDPVRLATAFEAEAGVSIDHFRTERRLDTVRGWLANDKPDISDRTIAKRIGFADVQALDSAFRAHIGISFANYRAGRFA